MKMLPVLALALLAGPRSDDRLVYVASDGIHVAAADGSDDRRLPVDKPKDLLEVAPSPDGSRIAFIGGRMPAELWVVDADGSNARKLTAEKGFSKSAHSPSWSPDSKRIAYVFGDMFEKDVWTVNADGSDAKNLTSSATYVSTPRWSPDGSRIVFAQQDAIKEDSATTFALEDLWTIGADGSDKKRITETPDRKETDPRWSPDGSKLLVTGVEVKERKENAIFLDSEEVWVMDADGSGATNLSRNAKGEDHWASWSPDGRRIAFAARKDGGPCSVYLMDADGSNAKALEEPAWGHEYHSTSWSSDGSRIVVQDGHDKVVVFAADGSGRSEAAKGRAARWIKGR